MARAGDIPPNARASLARVMGKALSRMKKEGKHCENTRNTHPAHDWKIHGVTVRCNGKRTV